MFVCIGKFAAEQNFVILSSLCILPRPYLKVLFVYQSLKLSVLYMYTYDGECVINRPDFREKVEILQMFCSWMDLVVKIYTASVTGEHF